MTRSIGRALLGAGIAASLLGPVAEVSAQVISGVVVDSGNGAPVGLAGIFALDRERNAVQYAIADTAGRYRLELPGPGEYVLAFERIGYFENETPLLGVEGTGEYGVDMEMRPEPIRLDPLAVTVRNEELADYLTLQFGQHPASLRGYRSIQGARLQRAKAEARDNTDLLRRLYIPVTHGQVVCVNTLGAPLPPRGSVGTSPLVDDPAGDDPRRQCGGLYLDGYRCRNEHLEEIDMDRIAVVVTVSGSVHLYTRNFDWTFRRSATGGC